MFQRHILGWFGGPSAAIGGLCFDTPDGGGGGGAPAGGAAVAERPAGEPGKPADAADTGGADHGADVDGQRTADSGDLDDDGADDDVIDALPEQQLRTRHRRTQRWLRKVRPLVERLRGPNRQFMAAEDIDRLFDDSRQYRQIDSVLSRSPEAVQFLMREQARLDAAERGDRVPAAADDPADQPFDEENWPFEVETAQGKHLLQMGQMVHEQTRELRALKRELQGVQTGFRSESRTRAEQTWKAATLTAAKEIEDPTARRWFINNISNTFNRLEQSGRLQTVNIETLIATELKDIRTAKKSTTRKVITHQSATVAANGKLPATPGPGKTQPAQGTKDPNAKRETLADASASFLKKYAR